MSGKNSILTIRGDGACAPRAEIARLLFSGFKSVEARDNVVTFLKGIHDRMTGTVLDSRGKILAGDYSVSNNSKDFNELIKSYQQLGNENNTNNESKRKEFIN